MKSGGTSRLLRELRSLRVVVFHPEDQDGQELIGQLGRIGCQVKANRLQSVAGPSAKTYSYNLSGNRINDGTYSFSYDSAQRLTNVTFPGGNSAYNINALGQRTLKSGTGVTTTHFTYDEMGKLMGEYDATGQPIEETLYLGDLPVAVLR